MATELSGPAQPTPPKAAKPAPTPPAPSAGPAAEMVKVTIDGREITAPKGTLLIRVAEENGIEIPRFCDHPLLAPSGSCRQCLVEVVGQKKPIPACTFPVSDGTVVRTQLTSDVARKAQTGIMEMLLINHPLDCPVCDKGGECPLQNQAMSTGRSDSRFVEAKRKFVKPIAISSQVLLDRERCILCQRCTRFSDEISGDTFIDMMERSASQEVGIHVPQRFGGDGAEEPYHSYFSGNVVQICPVGALTATQYRFRARPFDLVSAPSVCEHCAAGCAQRTDHRRSRVVRRWAGDDPAVNEEWNCDKGRWAFQYASARDRLVSPLVRDGGELRPASWPEALAAAAEGLTRARDEGGGVGVLTGGRLTVEDAYAYSKFARAVLHTNDIDFRARPLSAEEADFLAGAVAGLTPVTYSDLDSAGAVVLAGLEPEEECPILFLRLRKAVRRNGAAVLSVAPFATRGLIKLNGLLVATVPGGEAAVLASNAEVHRALSADGAVLLVGERLATVPGALSAAMAVAKHTGARLAWVPRRAGDRGAVDMGCLPNLLPGGRVVIDPAARAEISQVWGLPAGVIPDASGRDTDEMIAAAASGRLGALVVAGVDPADLSDPALADRALSEVGFLVSLEVRPSAVTRQADVVFPVAAVVEKAGTFLNWEGRPRRFDGVFVTAAMPDARVLDALADEMGVPLGCAEVAAIRRELAGVPESEALRAPGPRLSFSSEPQPGPGEVVLATWHHLIDSGTLLQGETYLHGSAPRSIARVSPATAASLGVGDGDAVVVATDRGRITLPALITEMPDRVVWVPTNSPGAAVMGTLGGAHGCLVRLTAGRSQ